MKAMMWLMTKYLNLCGYMASQKKDVDSYIREFPIAIFKYYYELRLDDVFA